MDNEAPSYLENPELVALEHKRLQILLQLKSLKRTNGLAFYAPHKKQAAFHEAANFHYRYVRTGNRFGKSQMGGAEDSAFAYGERLWLPKNDPVRYLGIPKHPTKGIIVCEDWDKSSEIFTNIEGQGELGKLFQYLPPACINKTTKNHSGYIDKIVISRPNGPQGGESLICIETVQSYKQSKMSVESSVWDWAHIDEPCPKGMFVGIARGFVDRGGRAWFTCTPLAEVWINDLFVPSRRTEIEEGLPFINGDDKWMVTGSIYDNPYNEPEAIQRFLELLTDDEAQCRINGVPLEMAGVVYKEFNPHQHILKTLPFNWESWQVPPKDYTIRLSIDPHPRTPHAVVFTATSPEGYEFVYNEIFNPCLIKELCQQINAFTHGYYVEDSLIDPAANTKDPVTGDTMIEEFFANGVFCEEATKDLTAGILSVKKHLRKRTANGTPVMLFSPELIRLPYEMDHYLWKADGSNKPIDKDDHTLECLYRLCLRGLQYVSPPKEGAYARIRARELDEYIDNSGEIDDKILYDIREKESSIRNRVNFGSLKKQDRRFRDE